MELNLNGADVLRPGDKGYNGDNEGAYVVKSATSVGIDLVHEDTGERINKMSHLESYEQDWGWFRDLDPGQRYRSGAADGGATYGRVGVVVPTPKGADPKRTWIRWEGNVLSNGYPEGHHVLECLQEV
jgi:hypothetical protein